VGLDITIVVEVQQEDGTWKVVQEPGGETYPDGRPRWHWDFYRQTACFAVLADIGNLKYKPISEPRGLPEDRDPVDTYIGEFGHSWLLLSEILAFDWDQKVKQRANIPKDQADEIRAGLLTRPVIREPKTPNPGFAEAEWEETYADACSNLMIFIRDVRSTLPDVDPERIRLVFGFDW
jgi:hypothetical protein